MSCNFIKENPPHRCFRTSRSREKFTGKYLCWGLFLNKFRGSRSQMFLKIVVLKNSQISQDSTCVADFFNKVTGPRNFKFIKKRLLWNF